MTEQSQDEIVRELLDRERIRDAVLGYANAVDTKDWSALRETFTDDAVITMVAGIRIEGVERIVEYLEHRTSRRTWQHHLLSVHSVEVAGDEASTITYHTSHQLSEGREGWVLQLVGRYRDRLVRDGRRWRIAEKQFELGWWEERERASEGDLLDRLEPPPQAHC